MHATAHAITHLTVFKNQVTYMSIDPNYYESLPTCFSILMPLRSVNTYRVSFLITGSLASIGLSCWFFIEASTLDRPKVPLSLGYWLFAEVMFWMTRHFEIRYLEERENSKASIVNMANCVLAMNVIEKSSSTIVAVLVKPFIVRNVIHALLHM
ncbi:uncharacterized protein LOC111255553 isoform X2 [Varroa destructor]|nr:uncharacterized protein LOC111255553 isoform X2 [Varroa destructor]